MHGHRYKENNSVYMFCLCFAFEYFALPFVDHTIWWNTSNTQLYIKDPDTRYISFLIVRSWWKPSSIIRGRHFFYICISNIYIYFFLPIFSYVRNLIKKKNYSILSCTSCVCHLYCIDSVNQIRTELVKYVDDDIFFLEFQQYNLLLS